MLILCMPLLYHYKDIQNDDENSGDTANTYLSPQQHNAKESRRVLAMKSERQSAMNGSGSKKRKKQRDALEAPSTSNATNGGTVTSLSNRKGKKRTRLESNVTNLTEEEVPETETPNGVSSNNTAAEKESSATESSATEPRTLAEAERVNTASDRDSTTVGANTDSNTDSSADSEQSSTVAAETMEVSNSDSGGEATQDSSDKDSTTVGANTDSNTDASANSKQSSNVEDDGEAMDEDIPKESDPPVASPIIIDLDYISKSFQHDPRAKEIIENGYLDFSCSGNHERETFCRVSIFARY